MMPRSCSVGAPVGATGGGGWDSAPGGGMPVGRSSVRRSGIVGDGARCNCGLKNTFGVAASPASGCGGVGSGTTTGRGVRAMGDVATSTPFGVCTSNASPPSHMSPCEPHPSRHPAHTDTPRYSSSGTHRLARRLAPSSADSRLGQRCGASVDGRGDGQRPVLQHTQPRVQAGVHFPNQGEVQCNLLVQLLLLALETRLAHPLNMCQPCANRVRAFAVSRVAAAAEWPRPGTAWARDLVRAPNHCAPASRNRL